MTVAAADIANVSYGLFAGEDAVIAVEREADVTVDAVVALYATADGGIAVADGKYSSAVAVDESYAGYAQIAVAGGLYDRYVDESNCEAGYVAVPTTEHPGYAYEVVPGAFAAKVISGETETLYASFEMALAAAQTGDTVQLLGDATLAADATAKTMTLKFDGFALGLGGYTFDIPEGVAVTTDARTDIFSTTMEDAYVVETANEDGTFTYVPR